MFNEPRIELKLELNADIKNGQFIVKEQVLTTEVKVYVCYDNVSCSVGTVSNMLELFLLVGPDKLTETLWDLANEYEYDVLITALEDNDMQYRIGDNLLKAKSRLED